MSAPAPVYSDAAANLALDAIGERAVWCSIHTDDPGVTGEHEIPQSTRQPITWSPAVDRRKQGTRVTFDLPGGVVFGGYVGLWSAPVGGEFYAGHRGGPAETRSGPWYVWVESALTVP